MPDRAQATPCARVIATSSSGEKLERLLDLHNFLLAHYYKAEIADPRREEAKVARLLNLPPSYVLIHRVSTEGIGVLCQLESEGPFRAYLGGAIAPGINLSMEALHQAAAKLPRVEFARPPAVVGKNTAAMITPTAARNGATITDAQIQSELAAQITAVPLLVADAPSCRCDRSRSDYPARCWRQSCPAGRCRRARRRDPRRADGANRAGYDPRRGGAVQRAFDVRARRRRRHLRSECPAGAGRVPAAG